MTKEIKGTLEYTILLTEDGCSIKTTPKIEDELAATLLSQSLCQKQIQELEEVKKVGIKPEFKDGINNQIKTLNRCSKSLSDTFNLLLMRVLSGAIKNKEEEKIQD
jgi:hypothetical protein